MMCTCFEAIYILAVCSLFLTDGANIETTTPAFLNTTMYSANQGTSLTVASGKLTLNVGLITPGRLVLTNILGYSYVASASTMAIQTAKRRGYLQNVNIKLANNKKLTKNYMHVHDVNNFIIYL